MGPMKNEAVREFTQFELTTEIITKLNTFNLTPTAKLVLLYLTTCYNPAHSEVFPKQRTIADKIGCSERSVTRAIQELFKEGFVLIECKYTNRYKFTSKIVSECPDKMSDNLCQNVGQQSDKLSVPCIEQTIEHEKEQTHSGGNVYKTVTNYNRLKMENEEESILKEYAIKHGARNIQAYVNTLKSTGSANKIIKESKKKGGYIAQYSYEETQKLINQYKSFKNNVDNPRNVDLWVELGKKLSIQK